MRVAPIERAAVVLLSWDLPPCVATYWVDVGVVVRKVRTSAFRVESFSAGSCCSRACVLCMTRLVVADRSRSPRGADWWNSVCPSPPTPRGTWWAHNCHNAQLRFALTHGIEEVTRAALAKRLWWSIALSDGDFAAEDSSAENAPSEFEIGSRI